MKNFFNLFKTKDNRISENDLIEKQKIVNSLMDVSVIYDSEFVFYNLLIVSLERIFNRYEEINNLSWEINIQNNKSNTQKGHEVKINVEHNKNSNIYYDVRDEERELSFELYLWSLNKKSKRPELLIDSIHIRKCEKKICSNIKNILTSYTINRDNRYEMYSNWLNSYIDKNFNNGKEKYIPLIKRFIENRCEEDINIPDLILDHWIYKNAQHPFLTASCNVIVQKRNDYLLYKKNITIEKRKEVLTSLIVFLINIKSNENNLKYDVILECDNDEISKYIIKQGKDVLFCTEYFKYHGIQSYHDKKWKINSNNLVNDFAESFGSDYKDYSKIKQINEEKNSLEAMLESDLNKENIKKRRM